MTATIEVRHPDMWAIVSPEVELDCLASGFEFLEGPAWHPAARQLTFSDIPGDCLYHWRAEVGATAWRRPSHMANGNTYDRDGRLVTCEHATSRVTRTELDGTVQVLAVAFDGLELNSPNDIVVKRDGSIYFTDPNFGRGTSRVGVPRSQQQPCQGVYHLDPRTGSLVRVADDFENPNGLCFSLDERWLYVNDTPRGHIRRFDVQANGSLAGGQVWAVLEGQGPGRPDGMKVDAHGHLYCCGPGGIHVFDERAYCLGVIRLAEQAANFTWGEDDLRSLLITASSSLYRLRTAVPGQQLFEA